MLLHPHLFLQWMLSSLKNFIHKKPICALVSNVFTPFPFLSQWTSEPYESIDASNSNAATTVRDSAQSNDQGMSQGLDKTQEDSAPTAPEPTDQKTAWERWKHRYLQECPFTERTAWKKCVHSEDCMREHPCAQTCLLPRPQHVVSSCLNVKLKKKKKLWSSWSNK